MATAKLFGVMRLKTKIKEIELPEGRLLDSLHIIAENADPASGVTVKELKNCVIMINGKQSNCRAKIKNGDEVIFLSPAGGG
ncbi:MAG: MoaD/ThiS family protein [Lachnospiraceae bacterium]|nr:MoaD/ThiS family protein [Lachnospiraceae bacterium]